MNWRLEPPVLVTFLVVKSEVKSFSAPLTVMAPRWTFSVPVIVCTEEPFRTLFVTLSSDPLSVMLWPTVSVRVARSSDFPLSMVRSCVTVRGASAVYVPLTSRS